MNNQTEPDQESSSLVLNRTTEEIQREIGEMVLSFSSTMSGPLEFDPVEICETLSRRIHRGSRTLSTTKRKIYTMARPHNRKIGHRRDRGGHFVQRKRSVDIIQGIPSRHISIPLRQHNHFSKNVPVGTNVFGVTGIQRNNLINKRYKNHSVYPTTKNGKNDSHLQKRNLAS